MRIDGGEKLKKPLLEVEASEAVRSCGSGDETIKKTWPEFPLPETLVVEWNAKNSD